MWAVIPLKTLELAKQRLAASLSPAQRKALMLAMVEDAVSALKSCSSVEQVVVVSRDQACGDLCQTHGLRQLDLEEDSCLNSGLSAATVLLQQEGCQEVMILHGDLPLVSAESIEELIASHRSSEADLTIAGCQHKGGTNAMVLALPAGIDFQFGRDSFNSHQDQALEKNLKVNTFYHEHIALDLDNCEDIVQLQQHFANSQQRNLTADFIASLGLDHNLDLQNLLQRALSFEKNAEGNNSEGKNAEGLSEEDCLALADQDDTALLMAAASKLRDSHFHNVVTFSKKVFIPLTQLCRDVCHYCTFAQVPKRLDKVFLSVEEVLEIAREGAVMGCKEALFTLGERPELRYKAARDALAEMGYSTTLEYLRDVAEAVYTETGLYPHLNPGCLDAEEMSMLRQVAPSMGIMLESASPRLCEKGMPHYGSPDKEPGRRLQTLEEAGKQGVPFTTGILIGIGETRLERIESLLAIRRIHQQYGHIQEIIVQNFRAKEGTQMANAPEPDLNELLWTISVARLIFGAEMAVQAPPNLSPGVLPQIVNSGINDWGGVSPLTPDYVNPEAPWPHLENLRRETAIAGKFLHERLTVYPSYTKDYQRWTDKRFHQSLLDKSDADGFPRTDEWLTGSGLNPPPAELVDSLHKTQLKPSADVVAIVDKAFGQEDLNEQEIVRLFQAYGDDYAYICQQADKMRRQLVGEDVTYVINRNINYTNICYFKCQFCAFSKGKTHEHLRGKPYDISMEEIQNRVREAQQRGATEVCMQGGIHPDYTGQHYLDVCHAVKAVDEDMHIHAFSPLEVYQGAQTLGISIKEFLTQLKIAGLSTLPGTAAEVLHDEVRNIICPDKINTAQWLEVIRTAHELGIKTTSTIMFGHVDHYRHWAAHLIEIRDLQKQTGGLTEFVPLPFVGEEAPIYKRGKSRKGPTFRESVLMHAISRLALSPYILNIQASWVKMGLEGVLACMQAGANDLGGTLMNESITRSAGASHGQEQTPETLRDLIYALGRIPRQRNTEYGLIEEQQVLKLLNAVILQSNPAETVIAV